MANSSFLMVLFLFFSQSNNKYSSMGGWLCDEAHVLNFVGSNPSTEWTFLTNIVQCQLFKSEKHIWCAWNSNLRLQDGGRKRIQ